MLGWQENLTPDEIPPRWMWTLDDELVIWFEEVERKRDEKYGSSAGGKEEPSDMMVNELVRDERG